MPTVPISSGPTVDNRPIADVPQNAQFTPDAFGAGVGQATEGFGQTVGQVGEIGAKIATDLAIQSSVRSAKTGDMAAETGTADLGNKFLPGGPEGNKGYYSLQGQDAVTYRPAYQKAINDLHQQVGDGMKADPRAQNMFERQSAQRLASAYGASGNYAMHQGNVADDQASAGRVDAYTNTLLNNPTDPAALQSFQQTVSGEASDYARRHGMPPDAAKAYITSLLSKGYRDAVLAASTSGDVNGAAGLFAKLSPGMDAATRVSLAQHLEPQVNGALAQTMVDHQMGKTASGGASDIADAIHGQESNGRATSATSVDGAMGGWQITPKTFAQYAQPGENITNPQDNERVGRRIIADLSAKAGGDPARIAVGYFSGPDNMSPPGSALPYLENKHDGNGKYVSSYVLDVLGRLKPSAPAGDATDANTSAYPDFATMQQSILDQTAGNPKLQSAALGRLSAAKSQYDLSTQATRDNIEKSFKDTLAGLEAGNDTLAVPEAQIRHVFRPGVAEPMIATANEARAAGQAFKGMQFASPAARSEMVRQYAEGTPGEESATPDASQFALRQRMVARGDAINQRITKAIAADPAGYAAQEPSVAAAYAAAQANDPKLLQAAVAQSQSVQRQVGVPAGEEAVLGASQAAAMVKQLHTITPEKGDMGAQLNAMQTKYGPFYGGVVADLTQAGLSPRYQMLAHANGPGQETLRSDAQQAFQEYDAMKDKAKWGETIPVAQKPLLEPALDNALANLRDTYSANSGGNKIMTETIYPSVKLLAQHYMLQGMTADNAATRAAGLVNKSYSFDGSLRVPTAPGMPTTNQVRASTNGLTDRLTDADLQGTTASEAKRSGTWFTNADDKGATLLKGTLQGGYLPVRKADGSYLSVDFRSLPTGTAVSSRVDAGFNAGVN